MKCDDGTSMCSYVLITPARNEEKYIEGTIRSVISQTVLPRRWVIVSDGSKDRTDAIVSKYSGRYPWIHLIRIDAHRERNFASKAGCFNAGYETLSSLQYDVIGNLDADVTFDSGFFAFLMRKFAANPALGVAGTAWTDDFIKYNYKLVGLEHVSGLCQLFRRECFAGIGGYKHIEGGGVDLVAVTTARMKGWQTRTFTEINCRHHRTMGTSLSGPVRLRYRYGAEDYYLGSHPLWEVLRCVRHFVDRPYLIGGLSMLAGYCISFLKRVPRPVSEEFVNFRRSEQKRRLLQIIRNSVAPRLSKNNTSQTTPA